MNRRDFLKGTVGLAAVLAVPSFAALASGGIALSEIKWEAQYVHKRMCWFASGMMKIDGVDYIAGDWVDAETSREALVSSEASIIRALQRRAEMLASGETIMEPLGYPA